ncbi:hypothetical protein QYM36_000930 [Artemia franciscana]|uniref:Uncharacterized protein n=1 Tax=Artemia franciscana TaxID=6661 RepID=A0AA88I985_ARTSF|nr:hypothetical protein QYM36_000930 [Artemia franciscana]
MGLLPIADATAEGQKRLMLNHLSNLGVRLQKLISIGFDNANVNTGQQKELGVLLRAVVPDLFILGCASHSLPLCSMYAAKEMPDGLDVFIRDVTPYVENSPKGIAELKAHQEFYHIKSHKLLQVESTRWLSSKAAIQRIQEKWNPLLAILD